MNEALEEIDEFDDAESQPFYWNSEDISSRINESGTRFPACIAVSALSPEFINC